LSALLHAPWQGIFAPAALCGIVGVAGVVYALLVFQRVRRQTTYQPEFEDWLFHVLLPFGAYVMLALSAFVAPFETREALFGLGAAVLLLLFIGIHNAWDAVTYHVFSGG
jgi:hypothetical protein